MSESQDKLSTALQHWDYGRMLAGKADRIAWLRSEAEYIKGMIHRATRSPVPAQARILQIGAGPCDVIDYWGEGERHAIDPLADEYKKVFAEFRDSAVNYVTGGGECLPFGDDYFDLVIIRNALDHVDDPWQTLDEIFRVLKPTGALYVWIYLYTRYGSFCYRTLNFFTRKFVQEPWAFTWGRILKALGSSGFMPCLPAAEDRPHNLAPNGSILRRLKDLAWRLMGLGTCRGFSCVALPLKGFHKPWQLPV